MRLKNKIGGLSIVGLLLGMLCFVSCEKEALVNDVADGSLTFSDEVIRGGVNYQPDEQQQTRGAKVGKDSVCIYVPSGGEFGDVDSVKHEVRSIGVSLDEKGDSKFVYNKKMPMYVLFVQGDRREIVDTELIYDQNYWATFEVRVPRGFSCQNGDLKIALMTHSDDASCGGVDVSYDAEKNFVIKNREKMIMGNDRFEVPFYAPLKAVSTEGYYRSGMKMLGTLFSVKMKSVLLQKTKFNSVSFRSRSFALDCKVKMNEGAERGYDIEDQTEFGVDPEYKMDESKRIALDNCSFVGAMTPYDMNGKFSPVAYFWAMPKKTVSAPIETSLYLNHKIDNFYMKGAMRGGIFENRQNFINRDAPANFKFEEGKIYHYKFVIDPTNGKDGKGALMFSSIQHWDEKNGEHQVFTLSNCTQKEIRLNDYYFIKIKRLQWSSGVFGYWGNRMYKFILPLSELANTSKFTNVRPGGSKPHEVLKLPAGESITLEAHDCNSGINSDGTYNDEKAAVKEHKYLHGRFWYGSTAENEDNPIVSSALGGAFYITKGGIETNLDEAENHVVDSFTCYYKWNETDKWGGPRTVNFPIWFGAGTYYVRPDNEERGTLLMPTPWCDWNKWGGADYNAGRFSLGKFPVVGVVISQEEADNFAGYKNGLLGFNNPDLFPEPTKLDKINRWWNKPTWIPWPLDYARPFENHGQKYYCGEKWY